MDEIHPGGAGIQNDDLVDEVVHDQVEAPVLQAPQHERAEVGQDEKLPGSVYVIIFALIIDLLGFALILPLMPSLLEYYKLTDKGGLYSWLEMKVKSFQVHFGVPENYNSVLFGGLLGSLFSCMQFLFSPVIGALSDVYGRKPVLIVTMIGVTLSHFIWAISRHFYVFVIARIVGGMSRGNISLSTAIVSDVCSVRLRGKGMALIGIAFSVGFILGPTIGAALLVRTVKNDFAVAPPLLALGLSFFDVLFLMICFKESHPPEKRAVSVATGLFDALSYINPFSLFSFKPVKNINSKGLMQRIGWTYFRYLFLYSGLEFTLCFLVHERFQFSSMDQGYMYLFCGLVMAVLQGTFVRRVQVGKEAKVAFIGICIAIPAFVIIGLSPNKFCLYLGLSLYSYASATVIPCYTTCMSKLGSHDQKGATLGTFRSLGYLARGLGPFVAALGYWCVGSELCYCIGGLLLGIPLYSAYHLSKDLTGVHEKIP